MNLQERNVILDAVFRAARDAAEIPLSAEEDGEAYVHFIVEAALQELAEQGIFEEPVRVRAVLRAISGYGKAG